MKKLDLNKSNLLLLFNSIFDLDNYYFTYLQVVEKIAKFNQINILSIEEQIKIIKKEEKQDKQQKELQEQEIQQQLDNLKQKNISIELFWREIVNGNFTDKNYSLIIGRLIQKGEPFEFLNGDDLSINVNFLQQLGSQLIRQQQNKLLVISILGPQSSGKSTLLNKIFGCHFLTSVGRCTKGMYLQLLKISNKQQFDNLFDYILLLDSEGLQNPNQEDQEFDKRLALFIISISDIIILNVKGELNLEFHNLIEICLFTLGKHQKLSTSKQITWCFNQNSQTNDKKKLFKQIEDIVENLKRESKQEINFSNISGCQEDEIEILGTASVSEKWNNINCQTKSQDWNQERIIQGYSKDAYSVGINSILRYTVQREIIFNYFHVLFICFNNHNSIQFFLKISWNNLRMLFFLINLFYKCTKKYQEFLTERNQSLSWEQFTKKVDECWQIVSRLPDVIEFAELKEQRDYEKLNKILNLKLKDKNIKISKQVSDLTKQIFHQVNNENKSMDSLQNVKSTIEDQFKAESKQFEDEILQELIYEAQSLSISKKIFRKIQEHLSELISSHILEGSLVIQQEIYKHERKIQEKLLYQKIEEELSTIMSSQQELHLYQKDIEKRKQKFNQIWMTIIKGSNIQVEQTYNQFQQQIFESICSFQKNYIYKFENSPDYVDFYKARINKVHPDREQQLEELSWQIFQEDFSNQSFVAIQSDIFSQKINLRFENIPKNCIINPHQYIAQNITYQVIEKQRFLDHIKLNVSDFINKIKIIQDQNKLSEIVFNFFILLNSLQIDFDYIQQERIKNIFKDNQQINLIKNKVFEYLNQIVITFKLSAQPPLCLYLKQQDYQFLMAYFPTIIKSVQYVQCLHSDKLKNYIVVQQEIFYRNQLQRESKLYNYFEYIISQNTNLIDKQQFEREFPKLFNYIMDQNNGWDKLCQSIYNLVKQEIFLQSSNSNSNIITQIQKEDDSTKINSSLILRIMRQIENLLITFNSQFAFFGISISKLLERKLYCYSIFIIWRFICYQKWEIYDQQNQILESKKFELLTLFEDEIFQRKQERSMQKAKFVAQQIYKELVNMYYCNNMAKVQDFVDKRVKTSSEIIQEIDQQLLIKKDQINLIQKNFNDQIILYVSNQKQYLDLYVNCYIKNIKFEICKIYQINDDICRYLEQIQQNLQNLQQHLNYLQYKLFQPVVYILKIFLHLIKLIVLSICSQIQSNYKNQEIKLQEFFVDEQEEQATFEKRIFLAVLKFLLGEKIENLSQFKTNIFENTNIQNNQIPKIYDCIAHSTSHMVYQLNTFLKSLEEEFQALKVQKIELQLERFNIQNILDNIQINMMGCDQSCPMCNRKCDSDSFQSKDHQHKCQNGHQLRGMNKILINSYPSLYTCEEIIDEAEIKIVETNRLRYWRDIKQYFYNWNFKDLLLPEKINLNKEKMMKIWNGGIGELVCKQLSKEFNQEIVCLTKHDIPMNLSIHSSHYIFILDDSNSMKNYWQAILKCVQEQFKYLSCKKNVKVSVIIFGYSAKIVINCQDVDLDYQMPLIQFQGSWLTFFGPALNLAKELVISNSEFSQTMILFYTDGYCSWYPTESIQSFCSIEKRFRDSIYFSACSQPNISLSLQHIVNQFNQSFASAQLRERIEPFQLNDIWTEIISKNHHKYLA